MPCQKPGSGSLAVVCVGRSTVVSDFPQYRLHRVPRAEMAAFISVPLKKSSEVDLVKPLSKFVTVTYPSGEEQAEYLRAVEELNKLRKSALGRPLDKHESSLEVLLRYDSPPWKRKEPTRPYARFKFIPTRSPRAVCQPLWLL